MLKEKVKQKRDWTETKNEDFLSEFFVVFHEERKGF